MNSVDRITDRPDMISAVDRGCKALTQTKKLIRLELSIITFIDNFFQSQASSQMNKNSYLPIRGIVELLYILKLRCPKEN